MKQSQDSKLSHWIFNTFETSSEGLALYRIFASLYILLFLLPSTSIYSFLGSMPADFYNPPPGPFMLFSTFPPVLVWYGLHSVLIISALCMLIGYRTKWASLLVGTMFFFLKGFMFGLGKIDHELLLIVVPILMAFSGWGGAYSIDSKRNEEERIAQNWVLALLALLIGFMFFTAGFPKILGGWFDLSTQATEGHFYKQFFVRQRQDLLAPIALNFNSVVWESVDYATIIFEIGFLAAIVRVSTTRVFLCMAVLFHFSIMMLMNIPFLPNFLAYAAFFNWSWLDTTLRERGVIDTVGSTANSYRSPIVITTAMLGLYLITRLSEGWVTLSSDLTHAAVILVCTFAVIAFLVMVRELGKIIQREK